MGVRGLGCQGLCRTGGLGTQIRPTSCLFLAYLART